MGTRLSERPPLAWSLARQAVFDRCKRRYLHRYYSGWGGWSSDAPALARLAYAHGKLTTLQLALGTAVHAAARELAAALLDRRPLPKLDQVRARVKAAMNDVVRSSRDVEAFLLQPRAHPMLQEVYYGGGLTAEAIARTAERLERCTDSLVGSPLWVELAALPQASILLVDSLEIHRLDGVPVYAAPDLAYLSGPDAATIVDFKTGNAHEDEVLGQLALYAFALREGMGEAAPNAWRGRAILLDSGEELTCDLTAADLESAGVRAQEGYGGMLALLTDVEANIPAPASAFPLAPRRAGCPACPFWEICEDEVRNSTVVPRGPGRAAAGEPVGAASRDRSPV
ncbi:MAG: hypothetical protein AVDCRST_MAG68-5710 [uncultured Gemmatimonadetes bacterium]|uniref:PD-(D/E)XK endonuclease-like domain-containing protein n=1 Tax=uncultured Gemmatimonadota bacterium TaxID=203437 RepID=A0A6J4N1T8_9BACT|nr:MAG: hypothetical protein AVDCRST_MAG68-5710 [uncultured Gemmatimonadota bacterium]